EHHREVYIQLREAWTESFGTRIGQGDPSHVYALWRYSPVNRIHVRTNLAEICRVWTINKPNRQTSIAPEDLARRYSQHEIGEKKAVVDIIKEFLTVTDFNDDSLMGWDFYDVFYWEHRIGKWYAIQAAENDMT